MPTNASGFYQRLRGSQSRPRGLGKEHDATDQDKIDSLSRDIFCDVIFRFFRYFSGRVAAG